MNKLQIVGPSFTSYSLAQVNRGLAIALNSLNKFKVEVVSNAKVAERDPEAKDLEAYPELKELLANDIDPEATIIYNNFPRDPNGSYGIDKIEAKLKIIYIAWEESTFPKRWIDEFNQHAHAVVTSSSFVREVLEKSGLRIPTFVVPNAVDDQIRASLIDKTAPRYPLQTTKRFRFLHISSGYPRKGTDLLIKAYSEEFSASDDICLVIKSLPHALNQTPKWIDAARSENSPEIELINADLDLTTLSQLIKTTDAGVYPTRAEGFGLPLIESMLAEKPLITTGYGAQLDFCNEQNSLLIDYTLAPAHDSQLANLGGMWADPNIDDLKKAMRKLYESGASLEMIQLARQTALEYTWENSASSFVELINQFDNLALLKTKKIVVLSERNNKSGIAEHTNYLHRGIDSAFAETTYFANSDVPDLVAADEPNIKRNWTTGEIEFKQLFADLAEIKPDIFHIEYHSGYFQPINLEKLLLKTVELNIPTILTLHAASSGTSDIRPLASTINKIKQVIVHSQDEQILLEEAGINNVVYMVIGNITAPKTLWNKLKIDLNMGESEPILATHGLLTNLKGIGKLIEATALLKSKFPNIKLLLLNAVSPNNVSSQSYFKEYQELSKQLGIAENVEFIPEFLTPAQILGLLSISDINILAYEYNGEAASAAVQRLIAAGKPMILTEVPPFSAMKQVALNIPNNEKETLAQSIKQLLTDKEEQKRQEAARAEYLNKHNWHAKQLELMKVYLGK